MKRLALILLLAIALVATPRAKAGGCYSSRSYSYTPSHSYSYSYSYGHDDYQRTVIVPFAIVGGFAVAGPPQAFIQLQPGAVAPAPQAPAQPAPAPAQPMPGASPSNTDVLLQKIMERLDRLENARR